MSEAADDKFGTYGSKLAAAKWGLRLGELSLCSLATRGSIFRMLFGEWYFLNTASLDQPGIER
jgi:hypothetical protein